MKISSQAKLIIPVMLLLVLFATLLIMPSNEIGSFSSVRASGEINQSVKVLVDREKGFERDQNGSIKSFHARDKSNALAKVYLDEPAPDSLMDAQVVELFGHMHGNDFVGKRLKIVK